MPPEPGEPRPPNDRTQVHLCSNVLAPWPIEVRPRRLPRPRGDTHFSEFGRIVGEGGDHPIEGTMDDERRIEKYGFYCQPCNYQWQMAYEVRGGGDAVAPSFLYLNGLPASPPAAGRLCPNCWAPSFSGRLLDEPVLVPDRR